MNPRDVLYLCSGRSFFSNDPGRKIPSIVSCWEKMGLNVHLICGGDVAGARPGSNMQKAERAYKSKLKNIPMFTPLLHSLSERRDMVHDIALKAKLREMIAQNRPDLIWERSSRLHAAGLVLARKTGIPYVLEWKDHLVPYEISIFKNAAEKLELDKNRKADFIVVESDTLRGQLAREDVDPGKIIVAHNAVDCAAFNRDEAAGRLRRRALGIGDDEVLAGYLGSYAFYHDAIRLVLAAGILRQRGVRVRVVMVGGGLEYQKCRSAAENSGLLGSHVLMYPEIPACDVPEWLSMLDIAVLPGSTDIICPIKVQEYMAASLATLAPDYPCNREVITDGLTGVLFKPKNEQDLASRLTWLANNPALMESLGRQARKEVIERFTWGKTWGAALKEIFRRME